MGDLCDYEIKVLRVAAGERVDDVVPGAAIMVCVERLKSLGLVAQRYRPEDNAMVYEITDAGRAHLRRDGDG